LFLSVKVVLHCGEDALALADEHSSQAEFMAETELVAKVRATARAERMMEEDRMLVCVGI
jgi:hypothetical protein